MSSWRCLAVDIKFQNILPYLRSRQQPLRERIVENLFDKFNAPLLKQSVLASPSMASSSELPANRFGRPFLASIYDLTEYDSDEEREKYHSVPGNNLVSAAAYITDLFSRHDVPVAVMGGFALRLMGGARETRDVDMVFQAPHKFAQMWDIIDQERRLIIPKQRAVSDVAKIFVQTGGEWDQCEVKMPVEVDLIQAGSYNSPLDVLNHRKPVNIGQNRVLYVVDLFYLLKAKLGAYHTREADRDRQDILFLIGGNQSQIEGLREHLDPQKIRKFVKSLSGNQKVQYAQLLGIEL